MDTDRLINVIIMITVFGLVFSIWCICVFLWLGQYLMQLQNVQKRLGIVHKETGESRTLRLWSAMQQEDGAFSRPRKPTLWARLQKVGRDAGWNASVKTVLLGLIGAAAFAFLLTYLLSGWLFLALGIAVLIVVIFCGYTKRRIVKRAALFERQLVDALGVASRALRAGHPLVGAFQLVAEEIGEPLGSVFFKICQEQSLGLDLKDSIYKVATTTDNTTLKLFATAVAIQFKSGGNLADLMDSLAEVVRARTRLNRRVRVITAQTQFSKRILIGLPVLIFFLLNIISPMYMRPFYTTTAGKCLLAVIALSVLIGSWIMNRIAVLRF